ncbi:hypothetical protein BJ912DRAFT_495516 [Pholiota molesta]|nr:hypothetical protein BJ912DRAFT_495516 [Pholiota molesta]
MSSSGSPLPNPHPLPNPYSPLSIPASVPPVSPSNNRRSMLANVWRQDIVVDDLGTPDQPPSETLLFHPPRERKPDFHPIVDDDEEDIQVERIALHERNDSTMLQSAASAGYAAGYDRPGPSTSTQGNTYSQAHGHSQGMDRHEPHNEDDDEFDLEEDERYRSRYPFSHGPAPRHLDPLLPPKAAILVYRFAASSTDSTYD